MFNQPHSARAATPWQPNAGIAQKLSSRGYTATSWTNDAPKEFADLGFPAKSSGFSAAHYQPTQQPLSQQAQASLALLEGEYRNEAFGEEKPAPQSGTETNAHLPFVMDHFGATRQSKLNVHVDATVLNRALAQAELAERLVVSPITSDEEGPELIVIHPDGPSTEPLCEQADVASTAAALDADLAAEAQLLAEVADITPDTAPAIVGGVAPDEVAQREAEHFAKGLAQAREEAAAELASAIEKAMAEGFEKGMQQGLEQGREEGRVQGHAEGLEQGLAQGMEEGKTQGLAQGKEQGEHDARAAVADEMAAQRVLFENVSQELGRLIADPKKFFEPLKRLALHMAEQVVVGELNTSSQAIERLVQRCLDELDHPVHGAVVLELHPEDKAQLQAHSGDFIKGMRLEAMHDMQRGSVRVYANDTVIEDLVHNRLEGLAQALLVDVDAWREASALAQPVVETQEEAEDEDVHS